MKTILLVIIQVILFAQPCKTDNDNNIQYLRWFFINDFNNTIIFSAIFPKPHFKYWYNLGIINIDGSKIKWFKSDYNMIDKADVSNKTGDIIFLDNTPKMLKAEVKSKI